MLPTLVSSGRLWCEGLRVYCTSTYRIWFRNARLWNERDRKGIRMLRLMMEVGYFFLDYDYSLGHGAVKYTPERKCMMVEYIYIIEPEESWKFYFRSETTHLLFFPSPNGRTNTHIIHTQHSGYSASRTRFNIGRYFLPFEPVEKPQSGPPISIYTPALPA